MHVVGVVWDWNMQRKLAMFDLPERLKLKKGECFLLFNRKLSMARSVNSAGEFIEFRAADRKEYDVQAIVNLVAAGWEMEWKVGARVLKLKRPPKKATRKKKTTRRKAPRRRAA